MKKIILTLAFIFFLCLCPVTTSAKSDWGIVKTLCAPYKKPIKLVGGNTKRTTHIILHRKNKRYIVVEKVISHSSGKAYGYDTDGYYIAYNKKVKKNKKVVSYVIYDPTSNECDEILYVVDNKMYR